MRQAAQTVLDLDAAHGEALVMHLKATLRLGNSSQIVDAALAAAAVDPALALRAGKTVAKQGDLEDAARILNALRPAEEELGADYKELAKNLATRLLKAGEVATVTGDARQAEHLWCLGAGLGSGNRALRQKVATARGEAMAEALARDVELDAQAYADSWARVLAIDPANVRAYKRLAIGSERCGNYQAAMECWGELMRLAPDDTVAPKRFARAAMHAGRTAEGLGRLIVSGQAMEAVLDAARMVPKLNVEVREALRNGDGPGAYQSLFPLLHVAPHDEKLTQLQVKTLRLLRGLMKEATESERSVEAARLAYMMLDLDADNPRALSTLARFYYKAGHYDDVVVLARRLVEIEPTSNNHRQLLERATARTGSDAGTEAFADAGASA